MNHPADRDARVLIVDDDLASLEQLALALLDQGFSVRTAATAAEALAEARRIRPSIVLSDAGMRKRDGFDLCAALQRESGLDSVPVVLLSGRPSGHGMAEPTDGAGVARCLSKPVDLSGLVRVIRQLVA